VTSGGDWHELKRSVLHRIRNIHQSEGVMKCMCKKCKHEYICKTNWIFASANGDKRSKKYNHFLLLHDMKPIKSHGRIITYYKECTMHILKNKNKYLQHAMMCSHEVLNVLGHSSYDNRIETYTKLHLVHNACSNAVPFVIRHMQSELQHFQSTLSNYNRTETPRFLSSTFSFRYPKSHSEPPLSFLLGGGKGCKKKVSVVILLFFPWASVTSHGCTTA
jgi:hypothetical protein